MLDLDASNLRDWMAAVGLLRLVSETTNDGTLRWTLQGNRYRLVADGTPDDLAQRCARWVAEHKSAWHFGDLQDVNFGPDVWRQKASHATGIETALWCALGSDGVMHRDGTKIQASLLEYGHGGGHQHWLASMRAFAMSDQLNTDGFERVLGGKRDDRGDVICRWDASCERQHAYMDGNPAAGRNKMRQDVVVNALAAIGLASCPSMPTHKGRVTPLVHKGGVLRWPIWTDALRIEDVGLALLCEWTWPTMEARRWNAGKLYCFSRGELRETQVSGALRGGSRAAKVKVSQRLAPTQAVRQPR